MGMKDMTSFTSGRNAQGQSCLCAMVTVLVDNLLTTMLTPPTLKKLFYAIELVPLLQLISTDGLVNLVRRSY
jgi:hypothetical protein